MIKIGFIDYFLDEWHANTYPKMIEDISNGECKVTVAYGHIDSPKGGLTTKEWCDKMGIARCDTIAEVIKQSDCIVVLSPDNPEMHWELCQDALKCKKRVFVDKTFAPDLKTANALFELAEKNDTPFYSTSALRFSNELLTLPQKEIEFVCLCGPGIPDNYLIHQFEPMAIVLKATPLRMRYSSTKNAHHFETDFENGKKGLATLMGNGAFTLTATYEDGVVVNVPELSGFFDNFIKNMLHFFQTGYGAVEKAETIAVATLIDMAKKAMQNPDKWITL